MAVVLGLMFGGWYAHYFEVVFGPVGSQWLAGLFTTTWWMLAVVGHCSRWYSGSSSAR